MSSARIKLRASVVAGLAITSTAAGADVSEQRIEALEQRIKVLERMLEIHQEEAATKARETPLVKAGEKGFGIESKDGAYTLKIKGLVQADGRFFVDDNEADGAKVKDVNDNFLVRRARPILEGSLGKLVGYRITPEFAGDSATLVDAYVDLKFSPAATVRAGKFKAPVGLERYVYSDAVIPFAEFGFPTELAPNRELGVGVLGELFDNRVNYFVALGNGSPDGRDAPTSDVDDENELAGRLFFTPLVNNPDSLFQGLGFGIGASTGKKETEFAAGSTTAASTLNNVLPRYRSPAQAQVFNYRTSGANLVNADGDHSRISPQLYYYRNSFGLLVEHITSRQAVESAITRRKADLKNQAWQLSASYVLTGEEASHKGVARPTADFDWDKGDWGAFELAARVAGLEIDDEAFSGGAASFADPRAAISEARSYGLGLNWYFTSNVKAVFDYLDTRYKDGIAATVNDGDRPDEQVFITRVQYQF